MSYRKGEITPSIVDRDYPHQVELRADLTTGRNHDAVREFCRDLSLAPRGHYRRRNDVDYNIWCFADPAHADAFQARFGGERQTTVAIMGVNFAEFAFAISRIASLTNDVICRYLSIQV